MNKKQILPILPPAMLGILGGGQLGSMFTVAAKTMGYRVMVLDPDLAAPAAQFADVHLCAQYDDTSALAQLSQCEAVTTEFENINTLAMENLAKKVRVSPAAKSVAISQNRILEKQAIEKAGLLTGPYKAILSQEDIQADCNIFLPGILKTATLGYDGKGQKVVNTLDELIQAFNELNSVACVLEKKLNLKTEASVVVCRLSSEAITCFPVAENKHIDGILFTSTVPSSLSAALETELQKKAILLANSMDYIGVMAVEFFIVGEEEVIFVNEIAPRPHNSGHYTLDACLNSQFQQQVRILCGLAPAKTDLLMPCTMVNILGDIWPNPTRQPNWDILLQQDNVQLHLYGKKQARPGRKMGHFNVLGSDAKQNLNQSLQLFASLKNYPS